MTATTTRASAQRPDPVLVEGIRIAAADLLEKIERYSVPVEPEFIATLRKLADNPVREDLRAASPHLRRQFDRDVDALCIPMMTDEQCEMSWTRWKSAQGAAC
jgi:hypothetical protein